MGGLGRIIGERIFGNSIPAPSGCPWGMARGATWGHMYLRPKDSNAMVGVCGRATQKAPEGYDRQTDKQTDYPLIIVR